MYDAIVVGARVAGAPTAMLLAQAGYRVLLVDRDTFPSDRMSSHYIQPPGVARLQAWDLLDRVIATGYAPICAAQPHTWQPQWLVVCLLWTEPARRWGAGGRRGDHAAAA